MSTLQNHSGFHKHRVIDGINVLHLVHSSEREHNGTAGIVRHAASHQIRIAGLRNDTDRIVIAQFEYCRYLPGTGRTDDRKRFAVKALGPFFKIPRLVTGLGQYVSLSNNLLELADDVHDSQPCRNFPDAAVCSDSPADTSQPLPQRQILAKPKTDAKRTAPSSALDTTQYEKPHKKRADRELPATARHFSASAIQIRSAERVSPVRPCTV